MKRKVAAQVFSLCAMVVVILATALVPASAGLIGSNFHISGVSRFPDVGYNSVNGKYLVAWQESAGVMGRFVTNAGALSGNPFLISEGVNAGLYPAVAYNSTNNEFFVTWDGPGDLCYGQRVRGSDGVRLESVITVSSTSCFRSSVAWSATINCYLVVYYRPSCPAPGFCWTQK